MRVTRISPLELRRSLGRILDAASAGERFLIERDHRPLAMLVSVEDGRRLDEDELARRQRALDALDRLVKLGEAIAREYPAPLDAAAAVRLDREAGHGGSAARG